MNHAPALGVRPLARAAGAGAVLLVLFFAAPASAPGGPGGRETPAEALHFALSAFRDGLYEPAAEALRAFLAKWPGGQGAASARYYLAEAHRRGEKLPQALAAYQEFVTRHPRDARAPEARLRMGELLEKRGSRAEALQAYAAVAEGPLRPEALHRMAALHAAAGEWMGAAQALGEFRRLAPPRDPRREEAAYDHALALDRASRLAEAEAAYRGAIREFPRNPRGLEFRRRHGFLLLALGRHAEAEKAFEALMRSAPGERPRADVRLGLAGSLMGQGKFQRAAGLFEGALTLSPSKEERRAAERGAAAAWWEAGDFARAAAAYRRLAASSAKEGLARYVASLDRAGLCGGEKGREALRFALGALVQEAVLSPAERLLLGDCLERAEMEAEASAQWDILLKSSLSSEAGVRAALRKAGRLEREGRRKEAAAAYDKLAEAASGLKGERERVAGEIRQGALRGAILHFEEGDCAGALRLLKTLPRDPAPEEGRAEAASLRAECAFRAKRWGEAEVYYEQVLLGARRPELAARARLQLAAAAEAKGDKALALRRLKEALPLLPPGLAREARLSAARLLREAGDAPGARAMLLDFARDPKGEPGRRREAWMFLAREAAGREDWREAEGALAGWRALSPPDPSEGLRLSAMVRWREGRCPEAAEAARQALEGLADGPERAGLARIAALCLLKEGKYAEAVPALEEAARLEPGAADAAFELALALERAGQGRRAAEAYARYLGRFAEDARAPLAALRLGRLRASEGSREEALSAFRQAARAAAPEVAGPAGHEIARHLEAGGKADEALAAYEALAGAGPLKEEWRRASAWRAASLRERRGDWSQALALYRRLAAEKGDAAESRQALARAERIEGYLKQVQEREEKMKKREPLLR